MPILVHGLRLALLFQNTFDTFKTLKPAPPSRSPRSNGQPSRNALAKRKRDMKGCLAVWLVWSCLLVYERNIERLVSLFIPFYDEVKCVVLLFFLFTRARGAEPIYLHVIRPLLKPYTATLDAVLDMVRMFGDVVFLFATFPFHTIASWLPWLRTSSSLQSRSDYHHHMSSDVTTDADPTRVDSMSAGPGYDIARASMFAEGDTQEFESRSSPAPSSSSLLDPTARSAVSGVSATLQYQIWHPPSTSYDEAEQDGLPASDASSRYSVQEVHTEEWRKYPAFPSAYPPTPITQTSNLYASQWQSASVNPIAEDDEDVAVNPAQVFDQSLLSSRVPMNPGLVDTLSDSANSARVLRSHAPHEGFPMPLDGDSSVSDDDLDDEEDEFDKTLRTPASHLGSFASPSSIVPPLPILHFTPEFTKPSSVTSLFPTPFTIPDNPSYLTTPMDTEISSPETTESTPLPSRSSPPVRIPKKRTLPQPVSPEKPRNSRTRASPVKQRPVVKRSLVRPRIAAGTSRKVSLKKTLLVEHSEASSTTASDDGDSTSTSSRGEQPQPAIKKRRVVAPVRPGARAVRGPTFGPGQPSVRTTRSSTRNAATSTAS